MGFARDLGGHGWLVNEHERYFFPEMQLVKPSGRLIKDSLQEESPI